MVMHARKPQRMNDGYFEKHQAHPYQNSKYSSSKGNYASSGERYERIRDSPNGNSYRSDSPDSQSPRDRDRAYQSKGSYLQKIREKERENRDYKMSRDKYSDCARSPKDKRNRETRDAEHRTNHDRSSDEKLLKMTSQNSSRDRKPMHNCQDKQRDDRERLTRVGDWSEHISSSGKKYYYNCKTEVSQWEKPREWVEREQRDRDRFSNSRGKDRGGNDLPPSVSSDGRGYSQRSSSSSHEKHSNSRGAVKRHWRDETDHHDPRRKHGITDGDIQSTQDMDISPGDSTPTSEVSYVHTPSTSNRDQQHHVPLTSSGGSTCDDTSHITTPATIGASVPVGMGPMLLATALPRLSQPTNVSTGVVSPASASEHSTVLAPSMVPPPTATVTSCNAPGPPMQQQQVTTLAASLPRILSQISQQDGDSGTGVTAEVLLRGQRANSVDGATAGEHTTGDGPPTPTHSENQDCLDPRKSVSSSTASSLVATLATSPAHIASVTSCSTTSASAAGGGVPAGVNSSSSTTLSSLSCGTSSLSALRPQGPSITPSLANYYRDDLVNHVRGWPADILEKQAQKLSEEAHVMGSLQCTKVSAELKSARSIVRLTEIQATLQEQRILFLRQQIKMLEDMKSQNSFMSDDS